MTKKKLIVKIGSLENSLAKFKSIWERAEKGEKFKAPTEVVSFENAPTLLKALSPKRLELLQVLHVLGPTSIRKLSKELNRDYSNVYQDVKGLNQIGIILESNGKYLVPWETIITEISLSPKRMTKHHRKHDTAA